jgi:hypothetical protein
MGQGNEPRSLRPGLSSPEERAFNFVLLLWFRSDNPKVVAFPGSLGRIAGTGHIGDKSWFTRKTKAADA